MLSSLICRISGGVSPLDMNKNLLLKFSSMALGHDTPIWEYLYSSLEKMVVFKIWFVEMEGIAVAR